MEEIAFGSPITDFLSPQALPNTARVIGASSETAIVESVDGLSEDPKEDMGWLDFVVEGNEAGERLSSILQGITEETANVGGRMQTHSTRVTALLANPGPGTAAQVNKIALLTASDMNAFSTNIEANLPELEKSVNAIAENFSGYVGLIEPNSEDEISALRNFRQTIFELLEGTKSGLEGAQSFRDAVAQLMGINKQMNRASRRMSGTLDQVISCMERIEAFCMRTLQVIDEKLDSQSGSADEIVH